MHTEDMQKIDLSCQSKNPIYGAKEPSIAPSV